MDNTFRRRRSNRTPSMTMLYKQRLYKYAKDKNIPIKWTSSVANIENAIVSFKNQNTPQKNIYNAVAKIHTVRKDTKNISKINQMQGTDQIFRLSIDDFQRIIPKLIIPANNYLLARFYVHGQEKPTFEKVLGSNMSQDIIPSLIQEHEVEGSDQYSDYTIHHADFVELEFVNLQKYSKSSEYSFFKWITNIDYNLDEFQVYHEMPSPSKKKQFKIANTPCFLHALKVSGVNNKIVNAIACDMKNYGCTFAFIREMATRYNLNLKIHTYKEFKGLIKPNITIIGDKTKELIELGMVDGHVFANKMTNISKDAIKYEYLFKENLEQTGFYDKDREEFSRFSSYEEIEMRNNYRTQYKSYFPTLKANTKTKGKLSFSNQNVKTLNSFQVISYFFKEKQMLLTPITLNNAPNLLNNQFQQVKSLSRKMPIDVKEIGRGKNLDKLKYGRAPFQRKEEIKDIQKEDNRNVGEMNGWYVVKSKKKLKKKTKTIIEEFQTLYFDFETFPDEDGVHHEYMVAFKLGNNPTQFAYGSNCAKKMLESLPKDTNFLCYAHNAGFDNMFLLKHMISFSDTVIHSGSRMKQVEAYYFDNRHFIIKDTMAFLNSPLAKLPEMFKDACSTLNLEKEVFPHNMINDETVNGHIPLDELKESFDKADEVIASATKIGAIDEEGLNVKKYAIYYCIRDVDVLYNCYEAFRKMMLDRFNQDIYNHISMPGLAYDILHNEGCYDGCYALSGVALEFVRKAIVGGRCMTRENKKHHTTHKLLDFDANSLYPSGMVELEGLTKGIAKVFKRSIPDNATDYVAKIRITKVGIDRSFPLLSVIDKNSRNFTNDIVGKEFILGRIAIEDIKTFQGVEYEIIEGLYWDRGFNPKIGETIKSLYDERIALKNAKNPLQNGIKLLMNSSYGKLIQKPIIKSRRLIKGMKEADKYIKKNIHKFNMRVNNGDIAVIEENKPLKQFYSPAHLGVSILDMSKRIMNRVMCLAEDIDAKIWYQDTDSMHIDYDALPKLEAAYAQKYPNLPKLNGDYLGQFSSDFELHNAEGEKIKNVWAKESIFLGKKSYIDLLDTEEGIQGTHMRMKGIPAKLVKEKGFELYKQLYKGAEVSFNLLDACPIQVDSKRLSVYNRSTFTRKVSFK